jgi:L-ascorbate metabolism protein UlaG (beta-lactamase superfamily)
MECGQYNVDWLPVHLFPDESVQAAIDAIVKKAMPIHWAGFALSYYHTWQEPAENFVKSAVEKRLDYTLPRIGEIFDTESTSQKKWWTEF